MKKIKGHSTTATAREYQSKRLTGVCVKEIGRFAFSFTVSKHELSFKSFIVESAINLILIEI